MGFTSDSHFPGIIQHKHCIFVHGHLTFLLFDETTVCLPLVVTAIFPLLRFAVELPTPTPRTIHLFYFAYCWFFKGKQAMLFKQVRFVSRFYSNQVLHKTRIRSHLHCLIFLFPLIIPLLFLLPMQFSFFSNIIQNYREFRYCFFYICNCSDTLSQLDLYLTSRFPWADMYSLSCKYCKSGIQKLSYPVNLIEVLFQYLTEPLKPPFLPTTSRASFG